MGQTAPGPRGHFLIGNLLAFRRDVLGLLLESRRRYGDIVRFRLGPQVLHLLSHPEHIHHVLVAKQNNYDKETRSSAKIRAATGLGLLTSNGDFWLRQRRLTQPAFQARQLASFTDIMTSTTAQMLTRWQAHAASGKPLDIASEMMHLTCTIVGKALFGADMSSDMAVIEQAATVLIEYTYCRLQRILDIPLSWPTPGNLRFRRALRQLDEIVYRLIRSRRQSDQAGADLLAMLLHRRDEQTGARMSEREVRNEAITLLLAGHETTANALAWTWRLLADHPWAARAARAEVVALLGERPPTLETLSRLRYTTRVFQESLRLYPPIWVMERRAVADDQIAGCTIPRGSSVVICPYVTHRHPDFWHNPEAFDPDRFLPERGNHSAYLPFGLGQRLCIGSNFAMMEAIIIIAMIMQRFRLELVPGFGVEPNPCITLRTRRGVPMTLHPHLSPSATSAGSTRVETADLSREVS
jgi:cytochrome P450